MPNVTIDLDVKLLPQLIVLSALTVSPAGGEPFIENHCCMVRNADELNGEIEGWINEIEAHNWTPTHLVARFVPRSVYCNHD